jgi:hypothetical protein
MADGGVLLYRWTAWLCADIQGRSREQWEKSEDRMRVGKGRRSLLDIESGEERVGEVGLGIYIYIGNGYTMIDDLLPPIRP